MICDAPAAPTHGFLSPAGPLRIGERATAVCDEGYRLAGEERAVCGPDGRFSEVRRRRRRSRQSERRDIGGWGVGGELAES